jgi:MFS family permease
MVVASLGSIVEYLLPRALLSQGPSNAALLRAKHVGLLSACNAISRLAVGAASDALAPKRVSRLTWVLAASLFAAGVWAVTAAALQLETMWILSAGTGLAYGTVFTVWSVLLRCVFRLGEEKLKVKPTRS